MAGSKAGEKWTRLRCIQNPFRIQYTLSKRSEGKDACTELISLLRYSFTIILVYLDENMSVFDIMLLLVISITAYVGQTFKINFDFNFSTSFISD